MSWYYVDEVTHQRSLKRARNEGMRVVNRSISGSRRLDLDLSGKNRAAAGAGSVSIMRWQASLMLSSSSASVCPWLTTPATSFSRPTYQPSSCQYSRVNVRMSNYASPRKPRPSLRSFGSVTAAVALILARNGKLTPAEVAERLARSARRLAAMGKATKTRTYGHGLLDLRAALA